MILNQDYSVCWPFTQYVLHTVVSQERTPSTAEATAHNLSVFLNFLQSQHAGLSLWDVWDHHLHEFASYQLRQPKAPSHEQINKILRKVISAYIYLQQSDPKEVRSLVGETHDAEPAQIRYSIVRSATRDNAGKLHQIRYIHHDAMLPRGIKKKPRKPIPDSFIDRLWGAIPAFSKNPFIRERLECALTILEQVAPRVDELCHFTVDAVKDSLDSGLLEYRITKTKKREHAVPFPEDLADITLLFVHGPRADAIDRGLRSRTIERDHGFLFVKTNGEPWTRASMINTLLLLRKVAGVTGPAHAHLFRHRWITKNAIALAKNMVGTPLERSTILVWLKELSGHLSFAGLVPYVDESFDNKRAFDVAKPAISHDIRRRLLAHYSKMLESCLGEKEHLRISMRIVSILEQLNSSVEEHMPDNRAESAQAVH